MFCKPNPLAAGNTTKWCKTLNYGPEDPARISSLAAVTLKRVVQAVKPGWCGSVTNGGTGSVKQAGSRARLNLFLKAAGGRGCRTIPIQQAMSTTELEGLNCAETQPVR